MNMSSPHSHAMTISQLTAYSQMQYSTNIVSTTGTISADSLPKNIMTHEVTCLDVSIKLECLVCSHFKRCDINIMSKVFKARQALLGKQ